MIGAIIGDIVGSRFEFNNHLGTDFELFHPDCTFTDDTICTIAVADWLNNPINGHRVTMRYWCLKYPSSYGGMFSRWIHDDSMGPYNSFGNGAAMRVSPVGYVSYNANTIHYLSRMSAQITHNHPEGIKGAQAVAGAIFKLRNGIDKQEVIHDVAVTYSYRLNKTCNQIRRSNKFDETCQVTVPQAFQCLRESTDFESAIRLAVSIGGDSDTIAAITGSLAEACYGIPEWMVEKALAYLPEDMKDVINQFKLKYNYANKLQHV